MRKTAARKQETRKPAYKAPVTLEDAMDMIYPLRTHNNTSTEREKQIAYSRLIEFMKLIFE